MDKEKNNNEIFFSVKFIIIGDQFVGKTNITHRLITDEFNNNYNSTIGMDYLVHKMKIDDKIFHLKLWDTAGSERYRSITRGYYSNSACAIFVYDITNKKSFDSIKEWVEDCKSNTNSTIHFVLVGNKLDLDEKREVSEEQGRELSLDYGMKFFESSALTGQNIKEIFKDSCKVINDNINNKLYDLNDPSNGIKVCRNDSDSIYEIDKSMGTISNSNFDIKSNIEIKKTKCGC